MTTRRRDTRRSDVYDAEAEAFGGTFLTEIVGVDPLRAHAAAITTAPWWRAHVGVIGPRVVPARPESRTSRYLPARGEIRIAPVDASIATLLHELAHVAQVAREQIDATGHGPAFRRWELDVVGAACGATWSSRLARVLLACGLAPAPPTSASHAVGSFAPVVDLDALAPAIQVGRPAVPSLRRSVGPVALGPAPG